MNADFIKKSHNGYFFSHLHLTTLMETCKIAVSRARSL